MEFISIDDIPTFYEDSERVMSHLVAFLREIKEEQVVPRRTEPKGAHKALIALVEECETELTLAGDRISNAKVRAETARRALNIYEDALEAESQKKKPNVRALSNVG